MVVKQASAGRVDVVYDRGLEFTGVAVEAVVVVHGSGHVCWDDAHYGEQVDGGGDGGHGEGQRGDVCSEHHPAQQISSD